MDASFNELDNDYGFIILRHVNSEKTNKYWNNSVKLLKTFYPTKKIIIIDDNSKKEFLNAEFEYKNIVVINSEFHGRGELLPYYYFYKNKYFNNAIILHDSVFIHQKINFEKLIGLKVLPIWNFNADTENIGNTYRITRCLANSYQLIKKLNVDDTHARILGMFKPKWVGCFGVQSFINHDFLTHLENKYKICNMVHHVKCRADRCCLERILGCIFSIECPRLFLMKSLFGSIFKHQKWGYAYEEYETDRVNKSLPKAVIKVWTGR